MRLVDEIIDAGFEGRLLERIEVKLRDNWLSKEIVEKEIAFKAATKFSKWAKLFAIAVGGPATILAAILAIFGLKSVGDLVKLEDQTAKLNQTANDLQSKYKPLEDKLPKLTQIATSLESLEIRVQNVETEVAHFAATPESNASLVKTLNSELGRYVSYLKRLGINAKSIPTIHIQNDLPNPEYGGYAQENDIFLQSQHATSANVIIQYTEGVLLRPIIGSYDDQWQFAAAKAGVTYYLTADYLDLSKLDAVDLDKRSPIRNTVHTWNGAQKEGGLAWGSFLWSLRRQFTSKKATPAIARAWATIRPSSPPADYQDAFLKALISAGLESSAVDTLWNQ
jgi:hypothetical protein